MNLEDLGWNAFFQNQLTEDFSETRFVGRVANVQKTSFLVYSALGERLAKLSGSFSHQLQGKSEVPVVGDWVELGWQPGDEFAMIHSQFGRQNCISRAAPGSRGSNREVSAEKQVIAANIDTVFLVSGLDRDFNLRRIERYLTLVYESGAMPVILLNKMDLCPDPEQKRLDVESIALGVPIFMINAQNQEELAPVKNYLLPGYTATFLGSSGVGKSTIINGLLGSERQQVNRVSDHVGKGQHTTTSRELIVLPGSGMVVDTPGMRELQLIDSQVGLNTAFEDLEQLAEQCRFLDCSHQAEPGCAVQQAINEGLINSERVASYFKLKKELFYTSERQSKSNRTIEKEKWRQIKIQFRREQKKKNFS